MNSEFYYQLTAILLLVSGLSISIYYRHKAQLAGKQAGDQISARAEEKTVFLILRSVFGLALWLGSMLYLINPSWMAWSQISLPPAVRWAGAIIGLTGVPLMYWVFSSLGRNVTRTTAVRKEHSLVTFGPYRYVRHPLYSVGMLNFLGFSLLSANWFIFACAVIGFAAIMARTPLEEQRLIERFGDEYRFYIERTGRYLPKL
ncbi:MAG: isoprenylcysteine carboxylmethyltransferase family protein [Chloroflexi bacterium]|nr:MAG: isoprenylcysteine carboxylmethyltransferase family protein [Chloroflexota bacterium]